MKSLRFLDRRVGYSLASLGMLLGVVAPSVLPTFASAAQLQSRSVEMSDSSASATGAEYTFSFTPAAAFKTVVIDFCSDSPLVGESCGTPTGMDASSATATFTTNTIGTIATTGTTASHVVLSGDTSAAASAVVFKLSGITNPSTVGPLYARIYTYSASSNWVSATNVGTHVDDGAAALSITDTIGVSAAVKETMTFCVAGDVGVSGPSGNCGVDGGGSATGVGDPKITLGHGTPLALDSSAVDTASDWAQISTNAASGATVRMKNSNACGGLERVGEPNYGTGSAACDIAPVGAGSAAAAITNGNALFGMLLGSVGDAPNASATPTGTLAPLGIYDGTSGHYGMGTAVSATYGDPIFDTSGAPISNKNVKLTFAASASPTTPAGNYKATMNLIATGTF